MVNEDFQNLTGGRAAPGPLGSLQLFPTPLAALRDWGAGRKMRGKEVMREKEREGEGRREGKRKGWVGGN